MNIALIGYGRMGHEIEKIAVERGHTIGLIIDIDNQHNLTTENLKGIDVAIEFTIPASAINNYKVCFDAEVPVVSGTTGWLDKWNEVADYCLQKNSAFFYASNFSLGVNLFFEINRMVAKLMKPFETYNVEMSEVHHTKKLDAPSGTAISLANDIIEQIDQISGWVNQRSEAKNLLGIESVREGDVPGTHTITYNSEVDFIEITHCAKTRKGFALGAVLAAEFSAGKKGLLSMNDLLNINK